VAIHGSPGPRELWSVKYPHIACAGNGRHNVDGMWRYADVRRYRNKSMHVYFSQSTAQGELTCLSLFWLNKARAARVVLEVTRSSEKTRSDFRPSYLFPRHHVPA
jgi:hypothetical protein